MILTRWFLSFLLKSGVEALQRRGLRESIVIFVALKYILGSMKLGISNLFSNAFGIVLFLTLNFWTDCQKFFLTTLCLFFFKKRLAKIGPGLLDILKKSRKDSSLRFYSRHCDTLQAMYRPLQAILIYKDQHSLHPKWHMKQLETRKQVT